MIYKASEKYGINNTLDNDPEAVFARIAYVYLRGPRYAGYHPIMNNNDTCFHKLIRL